MRNESDSSDNEPVDAGIKDKQELIKKIEVLMGPSEDEAPTSVSVRQDAVPPATAPEVADDTAETPESEPVAEKDTEVTEPESAEVALQPEVVEAELSPTEPIAEQTESGLPVPSEEQPPETSEPAASDDELVDEIIAKEGDDLLAAEDVKIAAALKPKRLSLKEKLGNLFSGWWHNRIARTATFAVLFLGVIGLFIIPSSRYFALNTVGVKASASVLILDNSTQQPLKNAMVRMGDATAQTDTQGVAKFERLKLGSTELTAEKRAFAPIKRKVTIGWGSNPLGDFNLTPVGSQYVFVLSDFLSGKPIEKAEATSGESSAVSDEKGKLVLTIDPENDQEEIKVSIKAESYKDEELVINANDKSEHPLKLAAARKSVFISKRSGKYDVYKIDADGKNEQLVLAGTGSEREDMVLVTHPTDEIVALVSTRENVRNPDGFLLSTLFVLDLKSGESPARIVQSERIQVVDWLGDRLVYVQIASGSSAASPKRHRLMSYDYKNDADKELAASNYFNDVTAVAGQVYFAPSSYQLGDQPGLHRVNPDGSGKQTVLDKEVWNIFRTEYGKLNLSVQQDWYDYVPGSAKAEKANGPPPVLRNKIYVDSPNKQRSLWVDERDGKGTLLVYDTQDKSDKVLSTQSGLKNPVRWLNDHVIVYRIHTDQETADYALSMNGGEPKKIRDVTNTGSVEQWYY